MSDLKSKLFQSYANGGVGAFVDACASLERNHASLWAIERVCVIILRRHPEACIFLHRAGLIGLDLVLVALSRISDNGSLYESVLRGVSLGILTASQADSILNGESRSV